MRQFFFTYRADTPDGRRAVVGNLYFECSEFPSNGVLRAAAGEKARAALGPDACVILTGWQEFKSKEDYDSFTIDG